MLEFWNLFNSLPLELKNKIRYNSGFITNEGKIIKDFNENLYIKKKDCIYPQDISYIEYLVSIGLLNHTLQLNEIILQLDIYNFFDSDNDSD